ncbi:MAG: UDP-N-acetyl glucosamine 2-epimerase, partial [Deltaproteobacteria bacterium]|nr:UDP-N-acetyl glucosamine 2-epimerase [Deltaproteobacteria bacterium]
VDNYEIFNNILAAVRAMAGKSGMKTIFPIHPRTRKRASEFGLMDELINIDGLVLIEPVNYLKMLALIKNAKLVLTDSGGLQEESCILGTPCLTLRENTERPETVDVGANRIAGTDPERIISAFADIMRSGVHKWKNPFGDGRAAKRIIDTCLNGQPEDEFTGAP